MFIGKLNILILLFLLGLSSAAAQKLQCSAFIDTIGGTRLAKNLDWTLGNGMIVFNPANEIKNSVTCFVNSKEWESKYSSITFNHLGNNLPLGGMNEAGLVIEELSTWPSDYPNDNNLDCLNELEWIQYQLDSFKSVEEVIDNIELVSINRFLFGLHYIIADENGNCAIVEFIDNSMRIYTGNNLPYPAVTNNNYDKLLQYYKLAEDSGLKVHNIENSQDRFLKIVQLSNSNISSPLMNCNDMMNILDSVRVADTRWSIVYDIKKRVIYFKTDIQSAPRNISLTDFENSNKKMYFNFYNDDKLHFQELNTTENMSYLKNLFDDLLEVDPNDESGLADKMDLLINIYKIDQEIN